MPPLFENPLPILAIGALAATFAAIIFFSRRTTGSLIALAGVIVATAGLLLVERWIKTDRELVEESAEEVFAAVEANDLPAVLVWVDPAAKEIVADANNLMPTVQVEKARATGTMKIAIDGGASPPTATSRFKAFVSGTVRKQGMQLGYFDDVEIDWAKLDGQWRITGYRAFYKGQPIDAVNSARGNRPVPATGS